MIGLLKGNQGTQGIIREQSLEVIIPNITQNTSYTLPYYPRQRTILRVGGLQNTKENSLGTTQFTVSFGTNSNFTAINGLLNLNCSPSVLADQEASINNIIPANQQLRFSWASVSNAPLDISFRIDYTEP